MLLHSRCDWPRRTAIIFSFWILMGLVEVGKASRVVWLIRRGW
jgi:hypothetical protein